ncbi:MAG: hypothetical protein OXG44_01090 [Gammaproteobacteria bacterium]|nr:hypothetical protein [Gammaproteobacteria bacterium]
MSHDVEYTDEVEAWWNGLTLREQGLPPRWWICWWRAARRWAAPSRRW